MGILDFFSRRKDEKPTISDIDYEKREEQRKIDRELAQRRRSLDLAIMAKQTELEKLKVDLEIARIKEEISDITGIEEDDDEFDLNSVFKNLVEKVLHQPQTPASNPLQGSQDILTNSNEAGVSLSDAEIDAYIARVPPFVREQAKKASDDDIKRQILSFKPDMSKETVEKFIAKLRI